MIICNKCGRKRDMSTIVKLTIPDGRKLNLCDACYTAMQRDKRECVLNG